MVERVHGGLAAQGSTRGASGSSESVVDMSTCVDAFGLFEPVVRALQRVEAAATYRNYPDPDSRLARGRLAEFAGVDPERIDVAPGAAELIWTLTRTVLRPGDAALVWKPCFSEFEHAAAAAHVHVFEHWFGAGSVDAEVARFFGAVAERRPKLAYLCAPTCPRGEWIPAALLCEGISREPNTTFVVDQSYLGVSGHAAELGVRFPKNAVLLRSVTKELGLPGVRVGYAIVDAALRSELRAQRPFWAVGAHAQAVLEVYVECLQPLASRRAQLLASARSLAHGLELLGSRPKLRDTHYFTVETGASVAAEVSARLFEHDVLVRDCTSFGLPRELRVVAHPQQAALLDAWASFDGGRQ